MKKILALVLALALVIVPMTFSASADAAITLTVGADAEVEAGDAIQIAVALDSADVCGAQFDIALGDLVYVDCDAASDSFVYDNATNTIKYVDADLEGMNYTLFTIDATIPSDAAAGTTYTPVLSNQKYSDYDEALLAVTETVGTYTVADAAPVAVLDSNIKFYTRAVSISDTIGVTYFLTKSQLTSYSSYDIEIVMNKYDGVYNEYVAEPIALTSFTNSGTKRVYTAVTGIGMYELGLNIAARVRCYDADGNFVAYSETANDTPAALLKTLYTGTGNVNCKTLITDLLNMSSEAQTYFAGLKPESDLADATLVNAGFDQTYASASLGTLNTVNNTNWASGATLSSSTNALTTSVGLGTAPAVAYLVKDKAKALDPSLLVMEVSYTTNYELVAGQNMTITETVTGADWTRAGNYLTYSFYKTCLYDGNKTVTANIYYNGTLCCTNQYSVETAVSANQASASVGSLYTAIGKFGASCRTYFGTT